MRSLKRGNISLWAIVVLAVCAAASAAIFSLLSAVAWRPLPLPHPRQLAVVTSVATASPEKFLPLSAAEARSLRAAIGIADQVSIAAEPSDGSVTLNGSDFQVTAERIDSRYFPVLGVPIRRPGGVLVTPTQPPSALLNAAFWQNQLGGNPAVFGHSLAFQGRTYIVAGIVPESSRLGIAFASDVWIVQSGSLLDRGHSGKYYAVLRMSSGRSTQTITGLLRRTVNAPSPLTGAAKPQITAVSLHRFITAGENLTTPLRILIAATLILLAIGISNLTAIFLAAGARRAGEIATRLALGAKRWHIARLLLGEQLSTGIIASALALLLAYMGIRFISTALSFNEYMRQLHPQLDVRVLVITVALCLGALMAAVIAPLIVACRSSVVEVMKEDARGTSVGKRWKRLQGIFVAVEVALAVVSLAAAALIAVGFRGTINADWTVNPSHVATANVDMGWYASSASTVAAIHSAEAVLRGRFGIRQVGVGTSLPGLATQKVPFALSAHGQTFRAWAFNTDPSYFAAMRIPIIAGTVFAPSDGSRRERQVLVNHAFAKQYFKRDNAVGATIRLGTGPNAKQATVVGMVGPVRDYIGEAIEEPQIWENIEHNSHFLLVATGRGNPQQMLAGLRWLAAENIFPSVNAISLETTAVNQSEAGDYLFSDLLTAFAAIALMLCISGMFAMADLYTSSQTRELATRLALGATRTRIARQVILCNLGWGLGGLIIGSALSLALPGFYEAVFSSFHVQPVPVLLGAPCAIIIVELLAMTIPAIRAARIQPSLVMR